MKQLNELSQIVWNSTFRKQLIMSWTVRFRTHLYNKQQSTNETAKRDHKPICSSSITRWPNHVNREQKTWRIKRTRSKGITSTVRLFLFYFSSFLNIDQNYAFWNLEIGFSKKILSYREDISSNIDFTEPQTSIYLVMHHFKVEFP